MPPKKKQLARTARFLSEFLQNTDIHSSHLVATLMGIYIYIFYLNSRDCGWMIEWFNWISLLFATSLHPGRSVFKNSHWPGSIFIEKMNLPSPVGDINLPLNLWWYSNDCPTPSGNHSLLKTIISEKTRFISHRIKFHSLHPDNYLHLNVHLTGWEFSQAKVCVHQAMWNWLSLIKVILKIKI